jgi:putative acetyltransferase
MPKAASGDKSRGGLEQADLSVVIREDDLTDDAVIRLLREHLQEMVAITPPGSVHALALDELRAPEVTFWSAWEADEVVGCAALKGLGDDTGEIKSMRTAPAHRRRGIASRLLEHVLEEARSRGYHTVFLETGGTPPFAAARALYERHGFRRCGPFGAYTDDPHSVFMRTRL